MPVPKNTDAATAGSLRRAVAASAVCAALVFAVWYAGRSDNTPPPSIPKEEPALEAEGARSIIVREGGHKVWEFSARRIVIDANQTYASAEDVDPGILYRNGMPLWTLHAPRVRLNQQTRDVDARGGVRASGPNGLTINTTRATWTERASLLQCPEAVAAKLPGLDISTGAASYQAPRDELRCTGAVTVVSEHAQLSSPRAVAFPKRRLVQFEGGVEILIHARKIPQLEAARLRLAP